MRKRRPTLASLWRHVFARRREERELEEELRGAVELLAEEKIAAGQTPEAARRAARIELGGVTQIQEAVRDVRPGRLLEQLLQDARYAARGLAHSPGFTAVAVLTLALGIGANGAIFSVLDAVLIRPLPYSRPDRLVIVWSDLGNGNQPRVPTSGPAFTEIRRRSRTLEDVAGTWVGTGSLTGEGEPEQIRVGQVTPNFLPLLGVPPAAGRLFVAEEQGRSSPDVVVVSDGLWRRRFGGDPALVGRAIRIDGHPFTVVGVMPPGFQLIFPSDASVPSDVELWRPFRQNLAEGPRDLNFLRLIGRLKPGVDLAQTQAELEGIAAALRKEFPEYATQGLRVHAAPLHRDTVRDSRPVLLALFGGVAMVTLIACANVANLLLARATRREREIALRTALGASRGRIARQLLTESLLLAVLGGLLGLAVGWGGLRLLLAMRPASLARIQSAGLSVEVLLFTAALTAATGVLCGLAPILTAARRDPARAFPARGTASPGGTRAQGMLVLAEVALGFVLLVGSGLMVRTFVGLLGADPGFAPQRVLTFQVALSRSYRDDAAGGRLFQEIQRQVASLPGVTAVGAISHLMLDDYPNWYEYYWRDGAPISEHNTTLADHRAILPGFFGSAGVAIAEGRDFTPQDDAAHPKVILVDETLARHAWPGRSALGQKIVATFLQSREFVPFPAEVVGVVRHVRYHDIGADGRGQIYVPYLQSARERLAFLVRADRDPLALAGPIRGAVASIDPDLAVSKVRPLESYVVAARQAARFTTAVASVLAGVALLLAFVGIYGVVACSVAGRTAEIGVRLALGGRPRHILWLILGQTLRLTGAGLAAGVATSLLLTGFLGKLLYGVGPRDPATLAAAALVLGAAGLLAAVIPVRRALAVPPVVALRHDG